MASPAPTPLAVMVVVGSTREGRIGPVPARWIAQQAAARPDLQVTVVDLLDADLPAVMPAGAHPAVARWTEQVGAADAFIVVTPEYNHSYPASLKQAIDLVHVQWRAKPVAMVSYGGMSGGLRAVEHLRPVFAEVHATTVRDTVSFHGAGACFGEDGQPRDAAGTDAAAKVLLDQLTWWGLALRAARAARPYG
ncbi:MAG TPA: NAD(P)H-dependent oxidoreductase [Iamia sp.]|nr:NAD(P)H-dependent oxidoreductase [Iamia sp.]